MASKSDILQLAGHIQTITQSLAAEWTDGGGEAPPFESSAWTSLSNELQNTTDKLMSVVTSPKSFFRRLQLSHYDLVALQVALEFHLFDHIPIDGDIALSEVSKKAAIDEDRIARVIRLLAIHGVFKETQQDKFAHTATSTLMASDQSFQSAVAMQMDEMYQAASCTAEAIRKSPLEQRSDTTPFSTRFGSSIFDFYKENPDKADRFGRAMQGASAFEEAALISLQKSYDWGKFGAGKIIDVGGGAGHVSVFLAKHFPALSFMVQDLFPPPSLGADNKIADNVEFYQHDFFQPQPITDGDAYFMKHSLHNHTDENCVKILKALVPALEKAGPATRLLINEGVLPTLGQDIPRDQHLTLRRGDMCMMVTLSAKERSENQFRELFKKADPRLEIVDIYGAEVTRLIEVRLLEPDTTATNGV